MDEAFDKALDHALHAWGENRVPSLDPAQLLVLDGQPGTLAQAIRAAHAAIKAGTPSVAVPYLPTKAFRRKLVRIQLDGLEHDLPDPGPVAIPSDPLIAALQSRLNAVCQTQNLGPHTLDRIELTRRTVRARGFAERVIGRTLKRFAVIQDGHILAVFDKQTQARAFGVSLAKTDTRDEANWELWALTGRATETGWQPLVYLRRRRRTQRGVFKVVGVQAKDPQPKLAGWVFAARTTPIIDILPVPQPAAES